MNINSWNHVAITRSSEKADVQGCWGRVGRRFAKKMAGRYVDTRIPKLKIILSAITKLSNGSGHFKKRWQARQLDPHRAQAPPPAALLGCVLPLKPLFLPFPSPLRTCTHPSGLRAFALSLSLSPPAHYLCKICSGANSLATMSSQYPKYRQAEPSCNLRRESGISCVIRPVRKRLIIKQPCRYASKNKEDNSFLQTRTGGLKRHCS